MNAREGSERKWGRGWIGSLWMEDDRKGETGGGGLDLEGGEGWVLTTKKRNIVVEKGSRPTQPYFPSQF